MDAIGQAAVGLRAGAWRKGGFVQAALEAGAIAGESEAGVAAGSRVVRPARDGGVQGAGVDAPRIAGRREVDITGGVDCPHAEGVLALAQVAVGPGAGAGDKRACVKLARKGHHFPPAGAALESESGGVDRTRVQRAGADRRIRRIHHRQVGKQGAGHRGDLAGEVDGAHGDRQLPTFGIHHRHGSAPEAPAKGGVDEGLAVHHDLHGGQAHIVARRAVEAQHVAAQLPGVGDGQRDGVQGDSRRLGVEPEGHRIDLGLRCIAPVRRARNQRVRGNAGHGDRRRPLGAGDQFRLAEGEGGDCDAVEFQRHLLQPQGRLRRHRHGERAGGRHIAQVARGDHHRTRCARLRCSGKGQRLGGHAQDAHGRLRIVQRGTAAKGITGADGGARLPAVLPDRVCIDQLAENRAVGEERLHRRILAKETLRRLERIAVAGKILFDQVTVLGAARIDELVALDVGDAVEVGGAGAGSRHHQARGQGVDHPAPDAGRDAAVVEHVCPAQVDLVLAFQPGGNLCAPGGGSDASARLHQRGRQPGAPGRIEQRLGILVADVGGQRGDRFERHIGNLHLLDAGRAGVGDHPADGHGVGDDVTCCVGVTQRRVARRRRDAACRWRHRRRCGCPRGRRRARRRCRRRWGRPARRQTDSRSSRLHR